MSLAGELDLPTIDLAGVPLHAVTEVQVNGHIVAASRRGQGGWVVTLNMDILRRFVKNAKFRRLIQDASLHLADGMPLVWASRLAGRGLPERVCGADLVDSLSAAAARAGRRVYLLGGKSGVADHASRILQRRHAGLDVVGTCCPPLGFEDDAREMARIRNAVVACAPDIVYVALGCPKQERLISILRADLPHAWFLGVGGAFGFVADATRRAPIWMQAIGAEWLHRLSLEPRRMAKRYLVDDLPFALWLFARALRDRLRDQPRVDKA